MMTARYFCILANHVFVICRFYVNVTTEPAKGRAILFRRSSLDWNIHFTEFARGVYVHAELRLRTKMCSATNVY
jgi:hypothetical protein